MTKIALCGALIGAMSLSAQDPAAVDKKLAEAMAQLDNVKVLSSSMISGKTVKGAPYSAQAVNEMVQVLADGNRITTSHSTMLYRDSQGRERREESAGGVARAIMISDPVDGVSYMLEPNSKIARKSSQKMVNFGVGVGGGVGGGSVGRETVVVGDRTETRTLTINGSGVSSDTFFFSNEMNSGKVTPKVEHLGMQTIEGVSAEGTRTTITIPAGQMGNELPLVTVTERWVSPELGVTVMNSRSDPRSGTTTYKLTNVNRSEPSPTLFQVPPDYTVRDMTAPRRVVQPEEQ
jgi:hypothetical protein